MQSRLDTETGVNKTFKNVSCQRRRPIQNFLCRGTSFRHFFKRIFFGRVKKLKCQRRPWGGGGPGHVSPGKFLKIYIGQWPF